MDNGAYNMTGPFVMSVAVHALGSMYRPKAVRWDTRLVDTATVPGGQMRGLDTRRWRWPRRAWSTSWPSSRVATRWSTASRTPTVDGQHSLGGALIGSSGLADCLRSVGTAIDWDRRRYDPTPYRGVGVAAGMHGAGDNGGRVDANRSALAIDVFDDGRMRIRFGASDFGTHQRTALAQIVADEVGVALEAIDTLWADTERTPFELGQWGSRGTYFAGHAARKAGMELAARIRELATAKFGTDDVVVVHGEVRAGEDTIPLGELVATADEFTNGCLTHESTYVDQIVTLRPGRPGRQRRLGDVLVRRARCRGRGRPSHRQDHGPRLRRCPRHRDRDQPWRVRGTDHRRCRSWGSAPFSGRSCCSSRGEW